jgi:nicotinate phosphoribosyltransferase
MMTVENEQNNAATGVSVNNTFTSFSLPMSHEPFTDKYFLRTGQILWAEGLNPVVRAQVFIRKGPGTVHGLEEAVAVIDKYSQLREHGGRVYALGEGAEYSPKETLMVIEAPVQDIVELETMYLGVISAETTKANDRSGVDLGRVTKNMASVVGAAGGRPVMYFGARHWRFDEDQAIAAAAFQGGASSCSTDIGAAVIGQRGVGTIPHALENIYAWKRGRERAVVEATEAFDRIIDSAVPRIALIDYSNREIDDSIATADALEGRLTAVRVDTCGENIMQGAREGTRKYWEGRGVTITGVAALRTALDAAGHNDVKIVLSSGFGDAEKVKAFADAERELDLRLFDSLGVGGVYESRMATMDIVAVGESYSTLVPMCKTGRVYRPNPRLERVM